MAKFDFRKITTATRKYNFHTHTQFCDGHSTIDEFCKAAVSMGFEHLGFTPHSPVPLSTPCNMSIEDVTTYIAEVRRAAEQYPRLHLYTSMEIDYLGDDWGASSPWFEALPLDYTISSVHFIPDLDGKPVDIDGPVERFRRILAENFDGDFQTLVTTFFRQSSQMVRTGGFDLIGHFDKIVHNAAVVDPQLEEHPWFTRQLDALVDLIIVSRVAVEINTKYFDERNRSFPHQRLFRRLAEAGVTLVINSDAHRAALLNAGRDKAFAILDAIKPVNTPATLQ